MGHINLNRLILLISLSFLLPVGAHAVSVKNQSMNVFNFQQKLANKGNASAQYKLACMYETGTGIDRDIEKAKHWYSQAAAAGIKAASDRMTYLSIKQQGYDKKKNSAWLDSIKSDAGESKGDAMFLLGQLYREGIGVKKDLDKSLEIFDKVSLLGAADVEDEIALIQQEIEANNKKQKRAKKKQKVATPLAVLPTAQPTTRPIIQPEKEKQVAAPINKKQKAAQQADSEAAIQAAKVRRYEKAMMQLKLEQKQIDDQQTWATGGDEDSVDDEI